jgi:hypothetical protein
MTNHGECVGTLTLFELFPPKRLNASMERALALATDQSATNIQRLRCGLRHGAFKGFRSHTYLLASGLILIKPIKYWDSAWRKIQHTLQHLPALHNGS